LSSPPLVVLSSWERGRSDNPRAIADELRRRGAQVEDVWLLGDEGRELLARADCIISNDCLMDPFAKAPHTRYLQTWHGTPLKRIFHDVARPSFPHADTMDVWLTRDVKRWDALLSQNPHCTDALRSAFRYEGDVLELGSPRNDVLSSPERDAIRAQVREELGIAEDARAVLYAPTWRDGAAFRLELDVDRLCRELGGDVVVLVRAHGVDAATARIDAQPGVRDVSGRPEIGDLYLAADVLVTDYSSVAIDFAITGKPMLFFVYDLDRYRDDMRGFYFDLAADPPGPFLTTSDDVIAALRDLDGVVERYGEAYARFRERFCPWDDGHASARVVDAFFGDVVPA
jgi:CDP-glycerol glycerophosphotransferase